MARQKNIFESPNDVRRYLTGILARVEKDELNEKKAKTLSSIAYQILQAMYGEMKERELNEMARLSEEIAKHEKDTRS